MHEPPYWPLTLIRSGQRGGGAVFCLPGAGASVTAFAEFAAWIEPSLAVYGLQPRGIDGVHPPHPSAKAAAEAYLPVILKTQRIGPVHLIGHSFGGWIAFEIATRLHRANREVGSLTVLDSEPPDPAEASPPDCDDVAVLRQFIEVVELGAERSLEIDASRFRDASDVEILSTLHTAFVRVQLLPTRSAPDILRGPIAAFAACVRSTYTPDVVYGGLMRLILVDDSRCDEPTNRQRQAQFAESWSRWAPRLVTIRGPGNHVTVLHQPHVETLAQHVAPAFALSATIGAAQYA